MRSFNDDFSVHFNPLNVSSLTSDNDNVVKVDALL